MSAVDRVAFHVCAEKVRNRPGRVNRPEFRDENPTLTGRSPLKTKIARKSPLVPCSLAQGPRPIGTSPSEPKFSLKVPEAREAGKWRIRFKAIMDRCDSHAEPKAGSPLSKDEINILKAIVVESADFRTK